MSLVGWQRKWSTNDPEEEMSDESLIINTQRLIYHHLFRREWSFLCFSSDNWSKEQVYPKFSWAINYDLTAGFVEGGGWGCVAFGVGQKTEKKYLKLGHIIMCSLCVWGGRHRKWSTVQDSFLQITSHTLQRAHFSKKWTSKGHGCATTCVTFWCFFLVSLSGVGL